MKEYIAFDVHKHYTWATVESLDGERVGAAAGIFSVRPVNFPPRPGGRI